MSYIVQADIESYFGVGNVARWSQLDADTTTADTDRIAAAIVWAESDINDRFRTSRYIVPFTGTIPQKITEWAAKLAGLWMYEARGFLDEKEQNKMENIRERLDREIAIYLSNARNLDASDEHKQPTAPVTV